MANSRPPCRAGITSEAEEGRGGFAERGNRSPSAVTQALNPENAASLPRLAEQLQGLPRSANPYRAQRTPNFRSAHRTNNKGRYPEG